MLHYISLDTSHDKGGIFTLYERIKKERLRLQKQLDAVQAELQTLPNGKLICSQNGTRVKWYQSDGHTKTYIPKKNRLFAEQLARKKFLTFALKDLTHELRALDFYLDHHSQNFGKTQHALTNIPGYRELLISHFNSADSQTFDWQNDSYEHNPKYPEQLIHKTASGNYVRSKSEVLIDLYLYAHKLPFRYECALHLGDTTLFPDFTILHPETHELFYWEHFGLMDEPAYYQNAFSKLQLYTSYGIIPSINLITTYETRRNPLSSEVIEKMIEHYFL